ncbi:unnamed protein product [Adineta steineri]|uniref:Uncharacterized protein n=1 Tax=Adineta steineri TaxID=433720 RepID=A0A813NGX1_9BILA|nr:unnamed protein product [Adineta steineri]
MLVTEKKKYPNTFECPCTSVSNEYSKFISSFTPTFNQICTSDFVSDDWLKYVNYRPFTEVKYHYVWDFRHTAYGFFSMIRTLCALSSQTINEQLIVFYSTVLLTENTISEDTFLANINAAHDQFINATENNFVITLKSVLLVALVNNLIINRLQTNWQIYLILRPNNYPSTQAWFERLYPETGDCLYSSNIYCTVSTGIYFNKLINGTTSNSVWGLFPIEPEFKVAGVLVGNLILYAVLQSNLSCLYNKTCLSELNTYLNDSLFPFNATPLKLSSSSLPTVQDLVEELMVDVWEMKSSYEYYFNACNPLACTYTYVHQFDVIYVITTVISFIGGIVTILMLVILPTVTFLRKRIKACWPLPSPPEVGPCETNIRSQGAATTTEQQIRSLTYIKTFVLHLNFFSDPDEQSEWNLRGQRLSTRLFIVSMVVTLSILVLYTSTSSVTKTITIQQPTVDDYLTLQVKYPQTLLCPCSSIANEQKGFISFQPTFHPVCYSDFITPNWTSYLLPKDPTTLTSADFRFESLPFFPAISSFCQVSLETIENELLVFNSTIYVTKYVQPIDLFQSQTQQLISNMKQTTISSFRLLISMLRQTVWGNALFSVHTYYYIRAPTADNNHQSTMNATSRNLVFYPYHYKPNSTTNCSCKIQPTTCSQLSDMTHTIHDENITQLFTVPGYYIGCYEIESMLHSTFECFSNEICLQNISNLIYSTSKYPYNATAMNLNNSHYNATTSVQYIIENLMIEDWNNQTLFQSYFEQCNPYLCTYSYDIKGDISYVFTITIGLIGGLTTILKFIVPFVITMIRRWRQKRRINVNPSMIEEDVQTIPIQQKLKRFILTFNLFKNPNKRSHEQLQHQRISTRLFFVIIIITLIILLLNISFEDVTHTIITKNPTVAEFNKLYEQYPNTVQCPCNTLSIEYQQFLTFEPRLHAICSSEFIQQNSQWITIDYPSTMLDHNNQPTYSTRIDDFRQIASPFFQLLNSFCTLSSQTINAELLTFYSGTFITLNLISSEQFQTQINKLVTQFIQEIARSFVNTIYVAENMTSANMIFSSLSTDSMFKIYPQYDYYYDYYGEYDTREYMYDRQDQIYNSSEFEMNCDCQQTSWCVQQAVVYDLDTITNLFSPPGKIVSFLIYV